MVINIAIIFMIAAQILDIPLIKFSIRAGGMAFHLVCRMSKKFYIGDDCLFSGVEELKNGN